MHSPLVRRVAYVVGVALLGSCSTFGSDETPTNASSLDASSSSDAPPADGPLADGGSPSDATTPDPDPYVAAVLSDNPFAFFRLADTSGPKAANDVVGSPVTGTYSSVGITYGAEGISPTRKAAQFDTVTSSLNILEGMPFVNDDPFTIEAWCNIVPVDGAKIPVFSNMDNPGAGPRTGQWMLFAPTTHDLRTETYVKGTIIFYALALSANPTAFLNRWLHLVFLHSNISHLDELYVDGTKAQSGRLDAGSRLPPTASLLFQGFQGRIADIAIYKTALSPTRINAHFTAR